uniref:Small ribosomal subunit protein uS17 N-terminal domain-containing protein n=1 Tax=Prolemur simus TaxID=1328070 RepID=A0A8C8Z2V3_PROSS
MFRLNVPTKSSQPSLKTRIGSCWEKPAGKENLPEYYKNISLGFMMPKEDIEGTYIDKKCPSLVKSPSKEKIVKKKKIPLIKVAKHYLKIKPWLGAHTYSPSYSGG